jgi:hypothetical protein
MFLMVGRWRVAYPLAQDTVASIIAGFRANITSLLTFSLSDYD